MIRPLSLFLCTAVFVAAADSKTQWHDIRDFGVEGRPFDDTEVYYARLPARAAVREFATRDHRCRCACVGVRG